MIFCRDWWPWTKHGYITMNRRQNNNRWSGGIAPQKNSECKNPLQISRLEFLGSRRHPPHWLSSKGPNYQRGVLLITAGAMKDILKETRPWKVTKVVLFLHDNAPVHRAYAIQKKLTYLGFHCLDHPPYSPDLAPWTYHLFSGLKKIERPPFLVRRGSHCCLGDLVGRTSFWIFWVACKSRAMV